MLGINVLLILVFLFYFVWNTPNTSNSIITKNTSSSLQQELIEGIHLTNTNVVQITTEDTTTYYQEDSFDTDNLLEKQAIVKKWNGIIISKKGYILTNSHVVDNLQTKYTIVTVDGNVFPVKKIRKDDLLDLAVLFVDTNLLQSEAAFIDIHTAVSLGTFVFAIGNPLSDYPHTVSFGIISGKWRNLWSSDHYAWFYQTDAALNPWNSWWPLLSLSGEVLGIITAISRAGTNIGFALPLNQSFISTTLSLIEENNTLVRPYLWISYTDTATGALIDTIFAASPGEWQLLVGDYIIGLDSYKISLETPLLYYLYTYKPWETVIFTIKRGDKILTLPIVLGQKTL